MVVKGVKISKKLTVALIVIALEFARGFGLELPPESYEVVMQVSMAYLGGQSLVDAVIAYTNPDAKS